MQKLPAEVIAERHRGRLRDARQKMRERQHAQGNVSLSVWVPADARAKAQSLARQQRMSIGEVVGLALSRLPAAQATAAEGDAPAVEWD